MRNRSSDTDISGAAAWTRYRNNACGGARRRRFAYVYPSLIMRCRLDVVTHWTQLRITVSKEGRIVVTATPLDTSFTTDPTLASLIKPPFPNSGENVVKVYIDIQQTPPSVFTQTKTTLRGLYEAAKERNKPTTNEKGDWDVLLHNEEGKVMETTIFNIAFYRSSRWLTPCTSTGCLGGVMRQWHLRAGRIKPDNDDRGESVLRRENIVNGEWVLLFNGVQGCRLGRIYDKSTSIPSSISPRI